MSERGLPLIELRGVGKRYGNGETAFNALHRINLKIYNKEFFLQAVHLFFFFFFTVVPSA